MELWLALAALICSWWCANGMLSPKGVNFEVQALMHIRDSLKDPDHVLDNWDGDAVDPCSWTMVTCSSDSFVVGLGIPSLGMSGTLSPSIGNLSNLQILLLQNNNMSGMLPTELGLLSKLRTLDLSDNSFSGMIPASLGRLTNLQYMRMNNNSFSGKFPTSLANLTRLAFLDLSYNNLSGPVPRILSKAFKFVPSATAGNPQICLKGTKSDCHRTQVMPMSMSLNTALPYPSRQGNHKLALALLAGVGCISLIVSVFGLFLGVQQRRNGPILFDDDDQHDEETSLGNLRRFRFRELQAATGNFSGKRILGKGGFGNVYKGILPDGTPVAIKRLKNANPAGGKTQFRTEIEMISLAVHRNLLRLHGYCITQSEKLLVYPYMSNGSVASRLKGKPTLDWATRKRIALGAAQGLLYLHEQCDPKIIHRDVKAANILLDDDCEAVIGDFGLAKLLGHRDSHVTTAVRGTVGHIAPEYLCTGQSSEKTDVFGFGILILELITGLRALEFGKAVNQKGAMLGWVKKIHQEKKLKALLDKDLKGGNYDKVELEELVQVALLCTQHVPDHRPRMSDVVRMLEGDGLAERWEAPQSAELNNKCGTKELLWSDRYSDLYEDSLLVQAMELSGPR